MQQLQNSLENLHLQYNNTLNHIYNAISYNQTPCQLYNPQTQQLQNLPALEEVGQGFSLPKTTNRSYYTTLSRTNTTQNHY